MKILRFNITIEDDQELLRVMDIPAAANFEELHFAILDAVDFDATQLSSFFICNNEWEKKVELTLINMGTDESDMVPIMKEIKLKDYEHEVGQKLIFEYDFVLMWRFFLEVSKIYSTDEPAANFPKIVESVGASPKQYDTLEKYPEEISDSDNFFIHELEMKNMDLFHHDEEDGADGEIWDHDDVDGLDDLGHENDHHDEDFY
jgi:hypothetical protein